MSGFRAFTAAVLCLALVGCPKAPGPRRFIRDGAGRALTLHGVNMSGTAKGDPERLPWVERDDVLRLSRDWGFNFVRYLVLWDGL
ncbi:MAG: glycoside hydrolase family 5 protein, partial [Candidatus Methylomirabilis sp.]|nr:glycoside hydrolase family 5 protein [Deltaproteobacteria bacterium]